MGWVWGINDLRRRWATTVEMGFYAMVCEGVGIQQVGILEAVIDHLSMYRFHEHDDSSSKHEALP
jgi:hypothetical protein